MTQPIDWTMLLKLIHKLELAKEPLNLFAIKLPVLRDAINISYEKANWKKMKNKVHKLYGSCCYTRIPDLKDLSQQLEETLKLQIPLWLEKLNTEIQRVLDTIQEENYIHD